MEKFILNIGLSVGMIETRTQEDCVLFHLKNVLGKDLNITTVGKERKRIMIVKGKTDLKFVPFKKLVQELCFLTSQNSIMFSFEDFHFFDLAYKKGYRGEFKEFQEVDFLRK